MPCKNCNKWYFLALIHIGSIMHKRSVELFSREYLNISISN